MKMRKLIWILGLGLWLIQAHALMAYAFLGRIVRLEVTDAVFNDTPGVLINAVGITQPGSSAIADDYAAIVYSPIGTVKLTKNINQVFVANLSIVDVVNSGGASLQHPIADGEENIIAHMPLSYVTLRNVPK